MATVNFDFKVDWKAYEQFVSSCEADVITIQKKIDSITNIIKSNVMVKGIWYDANAAKFAIWWNSQIKNNTGFTASYTDVKTAFSELCHQPCVNLRKSQAETIDSLNIPKIKLYSKADTIYVAGIKKTCESYTFANTAVKDGDVTEVKKEKINEMVQTLSKELKALDTVCTEFANRVLKLSTKTEGGFYIDGLGSASMARTVLRAGNIFGTELQKQIDASCTGVNAISSVITGYSKIETV